MDRLKNIFVLICTLSNIIFGSAQEIPISKNNQEIASNFQESIFVHFNGTTFVSGETLMYSLYCLNSKSNIKSTISKIGYLEILDQNHKNVYKSKINIENGIGNGDVFIPTSFHNGIYKMVFYTNWMINKSENSFFEQDIMIINPFESINDNKNISNQINLDVKNQNTEIINNNNSIIENKIKLELEKKVFFNREKVNLKLKPIDTKFLKGNYSISIRKKEDLSLQNQLNAIEYTKSNNQTTNLSSNTQLHLPELRGELLSGTIIAKKTGKEIKDKTITLSIPCENFVFKTTKTNDLGQYIFILDKFPNNTNTIIQIMDEDRDEYILNIENSNEIDLKKINFTSEFNISPQYKKAIEARSIASQIENAFYKNKKDSIITNPKTNSFFHTLEKEYILDDYTRFSTLKETITEVLSEVYYKQKNKQYSIHLRENSNTAEAFGNPLIMVDGVLIQDINELFDIDMSTVFKVSLVNQPYVYGTSIFSGIINFVTKDTNYQTKATGNFIKKTTILRPSNTKIYFKPDYSNSTQNDRIPDYRIQLLWEPNFILENTETTITFYTSDVSGDYEIMIEGFLENGIPVSEKESFNVN